MANSKTTKKALFTSMMSLLLCFTMLMGTTFAWFTDSVKSTNNIIKSGNLDIDVQYTLDGESWKDLDSAEDLFQKGLWEPGHTEVVVLKITNNGSLALKYNANMNIISETVGKTKDGANIVLSDILTVSTCTQQYTDGNGNVASGADIFPAMAFNNEGGMEGWIGYQTTSTFKAGNVLKSDKQLQPKEADYIAVKVDMAETVTNEANHNGIEVPAIEFGINVLATQFTYENDSFGNQYDKDSEYDYDYVVSTSADLVDAFANGGTVKLEGDIQLDEVLYLSEGTEVYLNMNGKTISTNDTSVDPVFYTYKNSKLTIDGNGKVELTEPSMSLIFPGGDVVIENGTFIRSVPAGTPAKNVGALFVGAKVSPWGSQTVTINGGYFDGGYYDANAADIDEILAGTKEFIETADDIAKRGNSKDANIVRVALKNNIISTLNLSYNLMKVYGGTFVGMNPAWGDEGCMLPTTPDYLRPWSYYQGALLDGQTFNENGIVLPEGYAITKGATEDGRPTYTVNYSK